MNNFNPGLAFRMVKKAIQLGRSERRGEAYPLRYVEPPSDARTKLGAFFNILMLVVLCGCSSNPYLEASLKPAEMEGKDKTWFEKNWGPPTGKASRFFGGEEWTYFRIAGGKSGPAFFNFSPNQCQITLKFDKEDKLGSYSYSGC